MTQPGLVQHKSGSSALFKLNSQTFKLVFGGLIFASALILKVSPTAELILFLISYVIVGGGVVSSAIKSIARGKLFNEHTLMTIATIGAFIVGQYPEAVGVMLFYLVGEILQDRAIGHSRKSISELMDIRPDYARIKVGDEHTRVSPESVKTGDSIIVYPGEKVPLDGRVIEGDSMVDTSALTGESVPRELTAGDEALSGFINKHGLLTIEVTKPYSESTVSKILELAQNASSHKAPTEKFITRFARYYTPAVVAAALAVAIIPPLVLEGATFSDWTYRALIFLVISCPCALVISIPLGFFGGIGGASKRGILIKGSNYLEALNYAKIVAFDKTGTLTKGVFKVTEIVPAPHLSTQELLEYTAYAESFSSHPIGQSIIEAFAQDIEKDRVTDYAELAGQGTKALVDGHRVIAGNALLMSQEGIGIDGTDASTSTPDLFEKTGTIIYVAIDGDYAGHIVISDELKPNSAQTIRDLGPLGIRKAVMLTGDRKPVADAIGKFVGVDEIFSDLLPAGKIAVIESLEESVHPGEKIVFVGDGINDAPVLARADIGIAMGGLGSDAAIEAADIVIMNDELSQIPTALRIAHKTRRIVIQNIILALGVKSGFMIMGALGYATMWEAVFADVGVTLLAIFNSMRALNTKNL